MAIRARRRGLTALGAATVSLLALAAPAAAATPPPWDSGVVPTSSPTCVITGEASDPSHLFIATYTDTSLPTITDVDFGHGSVYVLAPGTTTVPVRALATETCSGVGDVRVALVRDVSSYLPVIGMTYDTTDAFHASVSLGVPLTTASAGMYQPRIGYVARRYDTFGIGVDGFLASSTASSAYAYVSGPWSTKKLYLLLKTTQTTAQSRTSVAKGKTVTFSMHLTKASGSAYAPAAGETVVFQTRTGTGSWVTRATRTTSSTGAASYSFAPGRTMTWRWVHANRLTGTYTAASVSAVKTIKVV